MKRIFFAVFVLFWITGIFAQPYKYHILLTGASFASPENSSPCLLSINVVNHCLQHKFYE